MKNLIRIEARLSLCLFIILASDLAGQERQRQPDQSELKLPALLAAEPRKEVSIGR